MSRKIIAIIGTLLAMALMVGTPVSEQAYAAEQPDLGIVPCTTYIKYYDAKISVSGGTATVYASVKGTVGVTTKTQITATLQKYNSSSSSWSDVTSWTQSGTGYSLELRKTKSGLSSGTYRVKAICQAYQGSWESVTVYGN